MLQIAARAVEALFLATPERQADGPFGLESQLLQDTHGLHHDDAAGRVVSSAGAAVPGVEVTAQQDDLVLEFRIGTGNLSIDIVYFAIVRKPVDEFQLHFNLVSFLEQADHAAMVFDRHVDLGNGLGISCLVVDARTGGNVEGAASVHDAERFLNCIELGQLLAEFHHGAEVEIHPAIAAAAGRCTIVFRQFLQLFFVVTRSQRFEFDVIILHRRHQQDLARHLAFVFLQVFLGLGVKQDAFALDQAVGTARPGPRVDGEGTIIRRRHGRVGLDNIPSATVERHGKGGTGIGEPHFLESDDNQAVGTTLLLGSRQARTQIVGHELGQFLDLGVVQAFGFDLHGPVGRFRYLRTGIDAAQTECEQRYDDKDFFHGKNGFYAQI